MKQNLFRIIHLYSVKIAEYLENTLPEPSATNQPDIVEIAEPQPESFIKPSFKEIDMNKGTNEL